MAATHLYKPWKLGSIESISLNAYIVTFSLKNLQMPTELQFSVIFFIAVNCRNEKILWSDAYSMYGNQDK